MLESQNDTGNRTGGLTIRPIARGDSQPIRDIIIETLLEYGAEGDGFASADPDTQEMHTAFQRMGMRYWVVEEVMGVVGAMGHRRVLGGGGIAPLPGEPDTCELVKMYFRPEIRGLGMGKKLLKLCLEEARRMGYKRIYLETLARMREARGLYEHLGFTQIPSPCGQTGHYSCDTFYAMEL